MKLPWYEVVEGETYRNNQVVVQTIDANRVYFSNPLKRGTEQPEETTGPERMVHPDGRQSMSLDVFKKLFTFGGKALL